MGFSQLLAVLQARRRSLYLVWGGVVLLALLVSLILPRQYTATADVVVEVASQKVANTAQLLNAVAALKPGEAAQLRLLRGGQSLTANIVTMAVLGALLMYVLSMAALFKLRATEPRLARP